MPGQSPHTAPRTPLQLTDRGGDAGTTTVVPRLPADLHHQARPLKAFRRVRGVAGPTDLLRGLLTAVLEAGAFRLRGMGAVLTGGADSSATAGRDRLRAASPGVRWLRGELRAAAAAGAPALAHRQRRVRVVDATRLAQVGGTGDDGRAHRWYGRLAGRMGPVGVTDQHVAARLAHVAGQPDDSVVADGGYGERKHVA